MKTIQLLTSSLALVGSMIANISAQTLPDDIDISTSSNGVVALPNSVPAAFTNGGFVKYTKIACPNGEAIHFVAQSNISESQIVRARTLLEFYLKDIPGSTYGSDKTAVINTMGTNDATLLLLNGSDGEGSEPQVMGQSLYENEMTVEGHMWYNTNDFEHRDASFEEILHLMHDFGIGVDGNNSISNPALPDFQAKIRAAQLNAAKDNFKIWPIGAGSNQDIQGWYNELSQENSLTQEYLASIIDSYYGLWDPWTEDTSTGMWGIYTAHDREEIETEDPMGWALLPQFFSPVINVDMIIDPTFEGIFTLTHDASEAYTEKSRYLQHVYLTGNNASGLKGNELYNRLTGNDSNNTFEGLKGNDRLDGKGGENTAVFTGAQADYTVTNHTTYAIVSDQVADRDGSDTLWNIDFLQFADQKVELDLQATGISSPEASIFKSHPYPNPANDVMYIDLSESASVVTVEVRSIDGQEVRIPLRQEKHRLTFDTKELSSGLYLIRVFTGGQSQSIKIVKE